MFNRFAVAFHHKPQRTAADVAGLVRQVRAQARTAVQLRAKHPHWRVDLAIGATAPQRALGDAVHRSGIARSLAARLPQRLANAIIATDAYYDELERAESQPEPFKPLL